MWFVNALFGGLEHPGAETFQDFVQKILNQAYLALYAMTCHLESQLRKPV